MTRLRLAAMAAVTVTLLAACGTTTASTSDGAAPTASTVAPVEKSSAPSADVAPAEPVEEPATDAELPEVAPDSLVPSVDVVDVRSGDTLDLASIVPSDKPVLLWAWAPHCPSCRAVAGDLEKFAAANVDRLTVVGLGTQDDLEYAKEFLADTGVETPLMLWDESFESWVTIGITAQPTWILGRGDGSFIDGWVGGLPEKRILELLDA
jgi:thiol-disulfide isomerase/thioredoxin